MADRVVLHVGLMKSGTSYVQDRMVAAPEELARHDVLFPGTTWRDQVVAVSDAIGVQKRAQGQFDGAWERMADQVRAWSGTAVISMEFLGPASEPGIAAVVGAFPAGTVEVVVTVRDLGRTLPAMWQESLKNGKSWSWREYLAGVRRGEGPGTNFWRQQDAGAVVRRWSDAVGAARTTIVTLPPPGAAPETLWERFCEAAGVPVDCCPPVPASNESLGAASAALMRRVNDAVGDLPWPEYSDRVKFGLAKTVLAGHRSAEETIGVRVPRWVRRRAAALRAELSRLVDAGVRVVGDLDDLTPVSVRGVDADRVAEQAQLDAAVHALAELLRRDTAR
ncbi:MAG TPA: hypothetical protein VGE38_00305 [Nocardioides sp.]|uniref:hypothetical protein n=1 Tax=Nocardioides sp. TaxID=35761 RepID=UPI002EDA284A